MGTSSSHGGPKDKKPLLPPWALPSNDDADNTPPVDQPADDTVPPGNEQPPTANPPFWQTAKTQMTKFAKSGGGREGLAKAGSAYVAAKGGARAASVSSGPGKRITASVGGFFSSVSSRGIQEAIASLGLTTVVGEPADSVFAKIAEALSPAGATREEVAARKAVNDVLSDMYEKFILDDGNLENLNRMTPGDVRDAIENCVSSYIYHRWLEELGFRIEKGAITESLAVTLENQMQDYVKDSVSLEVTGIDVLNFDWHGTAGQELIERVFQDAYSILEAES
ncbi:MAG: hypothetical protein L6300_13950 [Syntrophaceae bacterium]|nr:hypothetical protein [Pseudomonadota bacterium]MCG2741317.1 hypothetical protein [Syntrophaceae bacterium]